MCDFGDVLNTIFPGVGEGVKSLPTVPELSGAEDAKEAAREQRRKSAELQSEREQERIQAAERRRMNVRSSTERRARGRASTILTGPRGVVGSESQAARSLIPG